MTIRYSRRALSQLASLYEYLEKRKPSAAAAIAASIARTIPRLRNLPLLGAPTDETDVHVLTEPDDLYRVFYRVQGKQVMVIRIRILHRAQH